MRAPEREALFAPMRHALAEARSVLSIGHPDGDGDSIGSQLALHAFCRRLGKRSVPLNFDPISPSISWLPGIGDMVDHLPPTDSFDLIFLMETTDIRRMGDRVRFFERAAKRIHLDHHLDVRGLGDLNLLDHEASSTCELLFDLLSGMNTELPQATREALYVGIMTDTGNFRFPNSTPRAHEIAAHLIAQGLDAPRLYKLTYEANRYQRILIQGTAMSRVTSRRNGTLFYTWLTRDDFSRLGATDIDGDGAVNHQCTITGAEVGLLFRELDNGRIKVSLRSTGRFDVCAVSRHFGGGGHKLAAGISVDGPLQDAIDLILKDVEARMEIPDDASS